MITLEHAFNAKDMNALVVKIIREQVGIEFFRVLFSIFVWNLDTTIIESI